MTALLTTTDAAYAAGVAPATIRKWAERGKIRRYGTPNRALWQLTEIAAAARNTPRPRVALRLDNVSRSGNHNRESAE
jgi:predicted site-specific integrase-resolvase